MLTEKQKQEVTSKYSEEEWKKLLEQNTMKDLADKLGISQTLLRTIKQHLGFEMKVGRPPRKSSYRRKSDIIE